MSEIFWSNLVLELFRKCALFLTSQAKSIFHWLFCRKTNKWLYKCGHATKGDKWISYDNQRSIRLKTNYAYEHNLAGVMVSAIDTDDFRGNCGGGKYPLLRTINKAFYEHEKETIDKK